MKFNSDKGASEYNWCNVLFDGLLFRLLVRFLLNLFFFLVLLLHQFTLKLELPGLIRDSKTFVLSFDKVVED